MREDSRTLPLFRPDAAREEAAMPFLTEDEKTELIELKEWLLGRNDYKLAPMFHGDTDLHYISPNKIASITQSYFESTFHESLERYEALLKKEKVLKKEDASRKAREDAVSPWKDLTHRELLKKVIDAEWGKNGKICRISDDWYSSELYTIEREWRNGFKRGEIRYASDVPNPADEFRERIRNHVEFLKKFYSNPEHFSTEQMEVERDNMMRLHQEIRSQYPYLEALREPQKQSFQFNSELLRERKLKCANEAQSHSPGMRRSK